MKTKLVLLLALVTVLTAMISCGAKRDCQGNRKSYNRQAGIWM